MSKKNILSLDDSLFKTAYNNPIEEPEAPSDAFIDSYDEDEEEEYEDEEYYEYIEDEYYEMFKNARIKFDSLKDETIRIFHTLFSDRQKGIQIELQRILGLLNETSHYTSNYYT